MSRRMPRQATVPRGTIGRAARYLFRYGYQAALPYLFLLIATLAQLVVPRLVRNIIDAVTGGVIATSILDAINKIPAAFLPQALPGILDFLKYPAEWTKDQLVTQLTTDKINAPTLLIQAGLAIVAFAIVRGAL